jgi:F-type H+-transporting ATPase subunit a
MEHHVSLLTQALASRGIALPDEIVMATLVFFLLTLLALVGGRRLSVTHPGGLQQFLEVGIGGFATLMEDIIPHHARRYLPLIGTFGCFILVSNVFGLIPTLQPPTASVNVTLGLALMSFTYYNVVAVKEMGLLGHLKHFAGPVLLLSPLMLPIELIAHVARNLSLSLRLFGNVFGEHAATGVFSTFAHGYFVPLPMMALGLFGALLQTFIFCVLSMVYIALATEH